MEQWLTLYTKAKAEYQVVATLQARGFEVYLPEIEALGPRQSHRTQPFFPCYLFTRLDFEVVGWSELQWTPGLRRIVNVDRRPLPLPAGMIDLLRRRLDGVEQAGGLARFKPGETVRITAGPFSDMEAVFVGPTTPAQRVQVLLTILGRASRVHLSPQDLEKSSSSTPAPPYHGMRRTRGGGRRIKQEPATA
jgi:transcription antitermination factor NusG